jgi:diguanylate cyclase (GGDEF)-like protein
MAAIRARAVAYNEEAHETEQLIRVLLAALLLTVLVLAVVGTRYLLRHTVRPLAELAQRAERQQGFPAPRADEPIREVHALSRALSQLDDTVRIREDELAHLHEDAVALAKFGEYVQQLSDEEELHDSFERVMTSLGAPSKFNIMIRNASKNRLEVVRPQVSVEEQVKHPILSEPLKCRAVRTLREVTANADSPMVCRCELGVPGEGSHLCIPMLAAGELIGVTNLQSAQRDHFNPALTQAVQAYAGFAGATVSSLRLIAATRERALRDGLTGAHNRAFLGEYMTKTLAIARRRSSQLGVLMVDLDHFKKINDVHGHLVGDQAIVALARCLQAQTRTSDAVVRYGGEEFVVLLLDTDAAGARQTAERIRTAVESTRITFGGIEYGDILRASVGVAMFPDHGSDEQSLLAAADTALYRAKREGRNRVVVAVDPAQPGATVPS